VEFLESRDWEKQPLTELLKENALTELDNAEYTKFRTAGRLLSRELGFLPNERGLVVNGRVSGLALDGKMLF
jgi:hypothetical protein